MKVAICYSGLYRHFPKWQENHAWAFSEFKHDIYYSTWSSSKRPPIEKVYIFEDPIPTYDPFKNPKFIEEYGLYEKHGNPKQTTNQIVGHQLIVDALPKSYDVIIRMRYDTWFGRNDWKSLVETSFKDQVVIGVGNNSKEMDKDKRTHQKERILLDRMPRLVDFMIIHPRSKMKNTLELYANKELFPSNTGWHQVLCGQHGNENYLQYGGGVTLTRLTK